MGAIFLSASVPTRAPFDQDTRPQEIQAAINALAHVVLGRKKLVWGGHPAITPLLWSAAQATGVEYAKAVVLFQSTLFQDDFPQENSHFANVRYIDAVGKDREQSLLAMRTAMLNSAQFDAAVFIGGMEGIRDEYELFTKRWPGAACIVMGKTGGAATVLAKEIGYQVPRELAPLDFVGLLYRALQISPRALRDIK